MKTSFLLLSLVTFSISAQAAPTQLTWHGHAAFEITTPHGTHLMIDPWLKNPMNPEAQGGKDPVAKVGKLDYIIVTHGHFDHVGDSVAIAKKTKARLVTNFELGSNMAKYLGFPKDQMGFDTLFNIGGEIPLANGDVTVAMVPAIHSSGLQKKDGEMVYGGTAAGIVLKIKDGPTIYDTGDTAYFSDMKLIGENYAPDVALINIGGHFDMEVPMAVKCAEDVKAKYVIPHHYKTFPILTQDATPFAKAVDDKGMKALVLRPGETIRFEGKDLRR